VLFLPGGLTGTAQRLAQRRSRRGGDRVQKSREILEEAA
jgi:branched-chain amino acid transport system permease protein